MTDTTELRAAFEKWCSYDGQNPEVLSRLATGDYSDDQTYSAWSAWQAAHASARNVPETPKEDLAQNWAGMDGATAFHLIERHADGWGDVGYMMEQWRAANASATQQHEAEVDALKAEVERYRNGNTAALEALMGMAWQYMGHHNTSDCIVSHDFMGAGEECCDVLEEAGLAKPTGDGCELDWAALEARKPKQQTWAEAVNELDVSDEEKARLLAFEADAALSVAGDKT